MGTLTMVHVEDALDSVEKARELPGVAEVIRAEHECDDDRAMAVVECLDEIIDEGRFFAPVADRRGAHAQRAIRVKRLLDSD